MLRLQTIATKYQRYLEQFYQTLPDLNDRPYQEQHTALMNHSFGAPDAYSRAFAGLDYEVDHIFANAEPIQERWAQEHGVNYEQDEWLLNIIQAQVEAFQPEILYISNHSLFTYNFLHNLRSRCPSIRLIFGWCGAPYNAPSVFGQYDIVLSNVPELVDDFRRQGHCCYHVNHAFDPEVLNCIDTGATPTVDFAFIGSIVKREQFHNEREELILQLIRHTSLEVWSRIQQPSWDKVYGTKARQMAYETVRLLRRVGVPEGLLATAPLVRRAARWDERPELSGYVDARIAHRSHPPVFGLDMFQQLHDSRVALNTHIDVSSSSASNMRLYEATGVGTCLLTDWKPNLPDLFEPEVEVVTYRSAEECIERARYLLEHEEERRAIAAAGQRRTLRDHTVKQRVEQIDEIIRRHLRKANRRQFARQATTRH